MLPNLTVVWAVFQRNLTAYFSNPIGYIFIMAFVVAANYFTFCHENTLFILNRAELAPLHPFFPYLLVVFVPAITMAVWAEERRSGTEELLLTLPATDFEVVLGKFKASATVYLIALAYCGIAQYALLTYLATPDLSVANAWRFPDTGLFLTAYVGYLLMGMAMIAIGMVASQLTGNTTVAFIYGLIFNSLFVAIGQLASLLSLRGFLREAVLRTGLVKQFEDFGSGLVTISGIFYFAVVTAVMLYLNMFLLSRRHWAGSRHAGAMWLNHIPRAAAILACGVALTIIAFNTQHLLPLMRVDATAGRIHDLSSDTRDILAKLDREKPVYIEAYLSPVAEMPSDLLETRRTLIDLLAQVDALSGKAVEVTINETPLYSDQGREAERVYGIRPERVFTRQDGRDQMAEVFMGLAVKSGIKTRTLPFVYKRTPVEYELTRLVSSVADRAKRKIGILETDLQLFGRFDPMRGASREAGIVGDLKQQYEVVQVSPDRLSQDGLEADPFANEKDKAKAEKEKLDVLIVPMGSSLTQPQMDRLGEYIVAGNPVVLLDDPLPISNIGAAPSEQKGGGQRSPFGPPPQGPPKGDFRRITDLLGIEFDTRNVVAQRYKPYESQPFPPEVVFANPGNGNPQAVNQEDPITSRLQEIAFVAPGYINAKGGDGPKMTPLAQTGGTTLLTPYSELVRSDNPFAGKQVNFENAARRKSGKVYTLAARIAGKFPAAPVGMIKASFDARAAMAEEKKEEPKKDEKPGEKKDEAKKDEKKEEKKKPELKVGEAKAIFIADADVIHEYFYYLRQSMDPERESLKSDNLAFFFNCVDELSGDRSLVELRKKSPKRTELNLIQRITEKFNENLALQEADARDKAEAALAEAQKRFDDKVNAIKNRKDLSRQEMAIEIAVEEARANEELSRTKDEIEREKKKAVKRANDESERFRQRTQDSVKIAALLLPPIPVFLLGLAIFAVRIGREMEGVNPNRRV